MTVRRFRIPNLGGARAAVLHREHPAIEALLRQLAAIGLDVERSWPDLPATGIDADFVFFDADLGFDAQFPWEPGAAPMPLVALIGSEAPGRIEWALKHRADAQVLKPVGNSGVYSALLVARRAFDERRRQAAEIASLEARVAERRTVVRAVLALAAEHGDEERAWRLLRELAMTWQVTVEEAARHVVDLRRGEAPRDRPARA
jgi:two-component system, response regulator / RNA-binding antiterminator